MLTPLQQTRKRYRESHKEQRKTYQAAYYRRTIPHQQAYHYSRSYGLTLAQYAALFTAQNNVCLICNGVTKGKKLVVDHDHKTGQVRGLLCTRCNTAIGFLEDYSWVMVALRYLKMGGK